MTLTNLYRIGGALAKAVSIPRQTIRSAVDRGEIPIYCTACLVRLVDVRDVRKWAVRWRKKGISSGTKPKR
jgi:hypothetical protein